MYASWLVFGVVLVLAGIFVIKLPLTQTIAQRIMSWVDLPHHDAAAPWRIRLIILVLLYPATSIIVASIPYARYVLELNQGRDLTDFEQSLFTCLEIVGISLQTSAWLGLIAYAVLRQSSSRKRRLIGWVIGYWTLAFVGLSLLSAIGFPGINRSLNFTGTYLASCALIMVLVTGWFWIGAKSTRAQLVTVGEENISTGLSLRDMLVAITGLGLAIFGLQSLYEIAETPEFFFDVNLVAIVLGPLFSGFLVAWLMAAVFLTRNRLQLLIGAAILVLLDSLQWIAQDMLERANANADIGDAFLRDSLATDLLLIVVGATIQLGALLCLKLLWHKIGLTISVGVWPTQGAR